MVDWLSRFFEKETNPNDDWWKKWAGECKPVQNFEQFVGLFSKEFEKYHDKLFREDISEYWKKYREQRDYAWREYQAKKK